MVYTSSYKPAYYTSLHDSIASICKSILPFRRRRLPAIAAAEQRLSEQQSDNLKWQQDMFHQILKLVGLSKEGILAETEVSAFRAHLLGILTSPQVDLEPELILRDKLVFLQELLYAKCISEEEYHSSKRPLLERLAAQGAVIRSKDVFVAAPKEASEEEWSVIDLKDSNSKAKSKTKGSKSVFGFISSNQNGKNKDEKGPPVDQRVVTNELSLSRENPFWNSQLIEKGNERRSILMTESLPVTVESKNEGEKGKKKMFKNLFQREENENGDYAMKSGEKGLKSEKKQWGFEGFKKWKRNDSDDETAPLPLSERSDNVAFSGLKELVASPIGEGPNIKQVKGKLNSNGSTPECYIIDKVLGEKIKKELSRIQTELNAKNPSIEFSDDQIEVISTRLPVDKADLKNFFPKAWCDRYGDVVLDVVRKEFKGHAVEKENSRTAVREKQSNLERWETFDDDENYHPNLFASRENPFSVKQARYNPSKDDPLYKSFKNNPFFPDYEESDYEDCKPKAESAFVKNRNPFWAH